MVVMVTSRSRVALVAVIVAATLGATGCTGGGSRGPGDSPLILPSPRAVNATTVPLLPTSRFALPEFDLSRFQALLRQLNGTPVVVNLWGSWCAPCREEAPKLAAAARQFGHRVQFLGVDLQDDRTNARLFVRDAGWPYPSVFDPDGAIRSGLGQQGQPHTLVFDRRGHLVAVFNGPIERAGSLAAALRKVL
jgi:thiol-disulfide isomerase/thioredoxin